MLTTMKSQLLAREQMGSQSQEHLYPVSTPESNTRFEKTLIKYEEIDDHLQQKPL